MMEIEERLRCVLGGYYEADRLDAVVSTFLRDPLICKMLNTPPRLLSDTELHSMCAGIDTRVRPAEVPTRKDEFLRGFAGWYGGDEWRKHDPKKEDWRRLRDLIERYWSADCDSVVRRAVGKYGVHAFYFLSDWVLVSCHGNPDTGCKPA